ncbi:MAG: hypothetical protein V3U92_14430 [Cellulophaga sp.]
MNTYCKIFLFGAFFFLIGTLIAQEKVSKKIEKTHILSNTGKFHIDNKYGDVIINGWDKNSIEVIISISVTHKKLEQAESILDRIIPNIKEAGDFLSISSKIEDKNQSLFSRYFNKANPFTFDKSNVQIDYLVYMPENASLDITNKFGDVILSGWTGKLKVNIQHGDLWINEDITNARIKMKFGNLHSKSIAYGTIELKNGSIAIDTSKNLRILSSGTTINIDEVSTLELFSSKDEISIGSLDKINGDLRFSKVYLNNVGGKIDLTMKLADFRVLMLENEPIDISIRQESSDIKINIFNLNFEFTATLEHGLLRIPKTFKNIKTKIIDKGKKIRNISATHGKIPYGTISINGEKGVIILSEK